MFFVDLGTGIETAMPEVPYPYNRMPVALQRLHWIMSRFSKEKRPQIVAIMRKAGHYLTHEGHEFILALPTALPDHEVSYWCKGTMSPEFRKAYQASQQG